MDKVIGFALAYIIVMPIVFRLIALLHKKLITDKKIEKLQKTRGTSTKAMPTPIWGVWKERLKFAFKDKRTASGKPPKEGAEPGDGLKRNQALFLIWGIGLVLMVVAGLANQPILILFSVITFFFSMGYGIASAKSILEARKNVLIRMLDIARVKLGQDGSVNPNEVVRVLDWVDYIKPNKVEFDVPTAFNAEGGEEGFLKQFNQIFGQETAWVPSDDPETHKPGWDYEKGIVTIHAVPPLPQMAKWDEHYVLSEEVAWSFFPIGLGVENGLELTNPETGLIENVLGFDVSGEQVKVAKKKGVKMSATIAPPAPMVFVGGGTGGGKSLSIRTPIQVVVQDEENTLNTESGALITHTA